MTKTITFKEFVDNCLELLKERPETANFKVVYASDEEGNNFDGVYWKPSVGYFHHRDFEQESQVADEDLSKDEREDRHESNAVCIN
jgi:hypothetical protein